MRWVTRPPAEMISIRNGGTGRRLAEQRARIAVDQTVGRFAAISARRRSRPARSEGELGT